MNKILFSILVLSSPVLNSIAQDTTRVLFLGNSYTYVNDLPTLIKNLGADQGKVIITDQNTPGGYTLNGHSTNATSLTKIQEGNWDFVVLQDQSQLPSFPPSQVESDVYPYAETLVNEINEYNLCAQPLFFMTWGRRYGDAQNCGFYEPLCTYEGMSGRLRESYLHMGLDNDALVSPVGAAWSHSKTQDSTIVLHSGDNSHPSLNGSYLAACVFYSSMFKESTIGNSYLSSLDEVTAEYLQQISHDVVMDSLSSWYLSKYDIEANTTQDQIDLTVNLDASSSVNGNYYSWDFGDGNTYSSEGDPLATHIYSQNGNYEIQLIVSQSGIVDCDYELAMPDTLIFPINIVLDNVKDQKRNFTINTLQEGFLLSFDSKFNGMISLIDLTGKVVVKDLMNSNEYFISNKILSEGIYIIRFMTDGVVTNKKIKIKK